MSDLRWYDTPCELCGQKATMHYYAKNPGTPEPTTNERGVSPFYPPEEADFRLNCCVECFWVTSEQLRSEHYVASRATAVVPNYEKKS